MDKPNKHCTRPVVLDALKHAAGTFAGHRGLVFLLRSIKFLLAALLLLCVADALFHLASGSRFGLLLGSAAAGALLVFAAIGIAFFTRPALGKIAQLLEHRDRSLGSKLTNVLELDAQANDPKLAPLTRDLARRAVTESAQRVDPIELPSKARFPKMKREFKWAFAPILLFAVVIFVLGEPARRQILRYLDPFGDHPPLSFTRLEISKPGGDGIEVLYGESIRIEARAKGHKPKELVLIARPLDGSRPPRSVPMATRGDGSFVVSLDNVTEPLLLTASTPGNRTRSKHRQLGVILDPTIEEAWSKVTPPQYTGLASRERGFRFTGLQALEGSTVEFRIRHNRPLGEGFLLASLGDKDAQNIPLQPAPEGPGTEAIATFVPTDTGRVIFELRDVDGRESEQKPASSLTITRDLPPQLSFLEPHDDSLILENHAFNVVVQASDDYGLRKLRLFTGINDEYRDPQEIEFDGIGPRRHKLHEAVALLKLGVGSGDVVTFYAEAIDNCPEPNIARTKIRRLEVISEEAYNEYLRKKSDVAQIAGKYEKLLAELNDAVDRQREITRELEDIKTKAHESALTEQEKEDLERLAKEQHHLNQELDRLAEEMENFGRENPVYDFEIELQDKMHELGEQIRESVRQNQEDMRRAGAPPSQQPKPKPQEQREPGEEGKQPGEPGKQPVEEGQQPGEEGQQPGEEGQQPGEPGNQPGEQGGPPGGGGPPDPQLMGEAAREHLERLGGQQQRGEEGIREPLEDLADLHELMKDFNHFRQLYEQQRQLAEQTKPFKSKERLDAADRLSLEEMAARQRQLGTELEQLRRKLEQDAAAAEEEFPQAAESARDLANAMGVAAMPALARGASQAMLKGDGPRSHHRAENLKNEMANLFETAERGGGGQAQAGLDQYLRLSRGMQPGNSFQQMMDSLNFSSGQGGSGAAGPMGSLATGGEPGQPQRLMGSESMLLGPIASRIAGRGDRHRSGAPGGGSSEIDRESRDHTASTTTRETNTPESQALLQEYESLTDAYFRFLTKPRPKDQ